MASTRVFKPSFSGGEISPEMFARIDDGKFQSGAASLENMIATPIGAAEKRPGFEFVKATKNNGVARLIPFTYSTTQTVVIEVGAGYFRFHTQGETLQYSATQPAYIGGNDITLTVASPCVVTCPGHTFSNGDPVFFVVAPGDASTLPTGLSQATVYYVANLSGDAFNVAATPGGAPIDTTGETHGTNQVFRYYALGDLVTEAGEIYYCTTPFGSIEPVPAGPGWYELPSDLTYEIPNPYATDDLFSIHYVQSADVMTLVHPNYPPMQLERLGAELWTLVGIVFGQALNPPTGVAVAESPGYQAQISTVTNGTGAYAGQALITTVSNHTLALGDGVYIKGLTYTPTSGPPQVLDGFYLVALVPVDGTGALIPNELYLMDYSGNNLLFNSTGAYSSGATIQYGSKIFNITNFYVVTAVAADGIQQSAISAEVSVLNNLDVTGSFNTITWEAAASAGAGAPAVYQYYIYKKLNGLYGYIGTTLAATLSFSDNNIAPDMSITPPRFDAVFDSAGNYPGAVSYFQQRRCFGGTADQPQNLWMTKSGTESDMSYSLPVQDTDRVAIGIAVRELATIEHIVPLLQLILLTSSTEISVSPINTDVITPATIDPRPQSYIGASNVQPTIVNNSLIYCAARGGHVREMGYQWQIGGYVTGDVSLRAAHLFDNLTIADQAFMKCAWQVVWFVSSNGNLLGLTYVPEQQIGAWHHHVTDGLFQSIACVAEGAEDRLYAVISRTVNGAPVNYIERMATRNFASLDECFFVDAGATFDGTNTSAITLGAVLDTTGGALAGTWDVSASDAIFAPTATGFLVLTGSDGVKYQFEILSTEPTVANTLPVSPIPAGVTFAAGVAWAWAQQTFTGLTWLEGETVAILGDGGVQPQQVVTGGSITIQHPCTIVAIGLPYAPTMETLPLVAQVDGSGQGRVKNINRCWLRLWRSSSIFAGPSPTSQVEYRQRKTEAYGQPPNLVSEEVEIEIPASWTSSGQIYVTQTDPLPLTLLGLTLEAVMGG